MLTDCRNFGYRVSIHKTCEKISSREFFAVYESIHVVEHKSDQRERPNPKSTKNEGQR